MTDSSKFPVVLIPGGISGLGLATAKRLANEHSYNVIIGSRNAKAGEDIASSLTSQGLPISSVQLDLDSDESISAAVDHIATTYGRLDVLINNAGILIDWLIEGITTRKLFTRTFSSNLVGAACLTDACLTLLRKSELLRRSLHLLQ